MKLSERIRQYAPPYESRDWLEVQTYTLRTWADEVAQLEAENERLREYYKAHMAIELGLADFDLHNDAVKRLEDARDALAEVE